MGGNRKSFRKKRVKMKNTLDFSPYKIIKKALKGLKNNEQKVICGRFSIDEDRKTLSAIGRELKLSRERIRQIEAKALEKIRKLKGLEKEL